MNINELNQTGKEKQNFAREMAKKLIDIALEVEQPDEIKIYPLILREMGITSDLFEKIHDLYLQTAQNPNEFFLIRKAIYDYFCCVNKGLSQFIKQLEKIEVNKNGSED